jgi:hypothetical protein
MDNDRIEKPLDENESQEPAEENLDASIFDESEDTQEVRVTSPSAAEHIPDDPSESNNASLEKDQADSGWIREDEEALEDETGGSIPTETSEGSPETGDVWWSGEPFLPMETLDDEITQPVGVVPEGTADPDLEKQVGDETEEKTVAGHAGEAEKDEADRIAEMETRPIQDTQETVYHAETRPHSSDNIPTIPPPTQHSDWEPERTDLPKPVEEVDWQATRVTPAAYQSVQPQARQTAASRAAVEKPSSEQHTRRKPAAQVSHQARGRRPGELDRPKKPKEKKKKRGCFYKLFLALIFLIILAAVAAGSYLIYQYFRISSSLPNVDELRENASKFETARILDREGESLV